MGWNWVPGIRRDDPITIGASKLFPVSMGILKDHDWGVAGCIYLLTLIANRGVIKNAAA